MNLAWSAHISWLFCELPFSERVAAARRAGFKRIETAWPQDADEREGLVRAVAAEGLEVVLLNCDAGDVQGGERGYLNDPARREEAERALLDGVELARRLGARNLNVLVGRELADVPIRLQRQTLRDSLSAFTAEASVHGLRLLLEPINSIENPGFLAPSVERVLELVEHCGSGAGVLLDVYHVAREGDDPLIAIERCAGLIGHVQLSDCPGRGRPGSGELDLHGILEHLAASGYEGSVGLEYAPRDTTERSLELLGEERYPVVM